MISERAKQQLETEGYIILHDIFSSQECEYLIQLIEDCYRKYSRKYFQKKVTSEHKLDDKTNEHIVYNLHNKHIEFIKLLDHPKVLPILEHMLQEGSYENSEPIIYANSAARTVLKGAPPQQLHIDSRCPGAPFALYAQVFFCLDDFSKENGATRIVPGSHKMTRYAEQEKNYPDELYLCAPKGSVLILNGGVWHGSGSNMTDQTRWAIVYSYARWFFKTSFDFNKNMPFEIYSQMNERQKELLGYKYNPPQDEFMRISSRSESFEDPLDYHLPT